jgi:hypothetical protein
MKKKAYTLDIIYNIIATYFESDPSKNQYCQQPTIKAEKGGCFYFY